MTKTIGFLAMIGFGIGSIWMGLNLLQLHWTPPGISMTDREFFLEYANECILNLFFLLMTGIGYSMWKAND